MKRRIKDGFIFSLLGLLAGAVMLSVPYFGPATVERMQIAASDFVFLDASGPRLGREPAAADIVLVLFDEPSASVLGGLPTYEQDLELYRALLGAGATVVADTRMIADATAEESSELRQFLDGLVATNAAGRLYRDMWTPTSWPEELTATYQPYVANNLLNMHPNGDAFFDARLYPMITATVFGLRESMPLILARSSLGGGPASAQQVFDDAKLSGIIWTWQDSLPEGMNLPEAMRSESTEPRFYQLGERRIPWQRFPTNAPLILPAGYWISYASPPSEYERVSYSDALTGATQEQFAGKLVLIGYSATVDPTSDTYDVPYSRDRVAAVEVVGAALETLRRPRLLRTFPAWVTPASTFLLSWLIALSAGLLRPVFAVATVVMWFAIYLAVTVFAFRAGWSVDLVVAPLAGVLAVAAGGGYRYLREVGARLRIVDLFGRYVPRAVVTQLVQQPDAEALALGGIKREVTVLFADIRGFTSFAEQFPPEAVLEQLNSLLKIMVDCTFAQEGTVDKFIGDAILVLFNAPLDQPDHALRAARTAWAIQQGLAGHASGLAVGIGIHRGEAVVGRVGTPQRMEYTAVGSTVNVASRLCSAAEKGQIVISQTAAAGLGEDFELASQPPIRVKGIEGELKTSLLTRPRTSTSKESA